MSIPSLEAATAAGKNSSLAPDDPFGTGLIQKLANELFGGRVGKPPAATPFSSPVEPTDVPATESDSQPVPTGNDGLARGYPLASSAAHPPVHPVLERTEPAAPAKTNRTPSGAHDPGCDDSYAFGEPRCNGSIRPAEKCSANPSKLDEISDSAYYFLPRARAEKPTPISSAPDFIAGLSDLEIENIRRQFPALHQRVQGRPLIWLDNAATTHKPQAVIDATSIFYGRDNSNIHRAAHTLAARATELFESGREKVRQFLGASDAKEIVFVRGTTEAVNLVAQSYGWKHIGAGDEIVITEMEHHANIVPWQLLAEQVGAVIRVAPMDDRGQLILEKFAALLGARTKLVAVTHVSNALGTINPIPEITQLAHARGVPVFVDGAQSAPHIPINVQALGADFFAFSGHKVFGPTGIGALYGRRDLLEEMPPWQGGGHMIRDVRFEKTTYQEAPEKFEAGTPDIAGVVGLGAALDYLLAIGLPALAAYEHALLHYATDRLSSIPGIRLIGTAAEKASVLSFVIPGVDNATIARHLDKQGIAVRAGHHCAQPAQRHFGLESSVRPSLAFYNTRWEVDRLIEALHQLPQSR